MKQTPFSSEISLRDTPLTPYDHHLVRTLSSMRGQYLDGQAYAALLTEKDRVLYEVYEIERPEVAGELPCGVSVIHPGKVGDEYFMTKGHFHSVLDTAEIYHTLQGEGLMVMETPEGESAVEELRPGRVLYVPPRWAHRSANTHPR
ncbi:MAG: glucose-6-phosphate isomerase family protein, partial [Rudaea sp.]